jgi:hypothetical protein
LSRLLSPENQPYPPEIIAGGLGARAASFVSSIATQPHYAFVSTSDDLGAAARQYFDYITRQVQARAQALLNGQHDSQALAPEGFRAAADSI